MEQNDPSKMEKRSSNSDMLKSETLHKIISFRNINNVVPIVSNSFRIQQIFRDEKSLTDFIPKMPEYAEEDFTISEQLTRIWAEQIHYPMTDNYKLWRVAQYHQVEQDGSDTAKEDYLEFLKKLLLDVNEKKVGYEEVIRGYKKDVRMRSFSEIVKDLDSPRLPDGADPLAMLAELPFPVYITTSHYDFLERAIEDTSNGSRKPRTQVIFWEPGREYDDAIEAKHDPDPNFNPSSKEPAVYHLFGLEDYPGSLVLSEDDYMKFLISVVSDTDTQKPVIPHRLRRALASSHLLLMGYHLRDWDFRVLFRFILNYRKSELAKQGIVIQLRPKKEDEKLLEYLKHYFNMKNFEIEWKSSEEFVQELWELWKGQQQ